MEQLCRERTVIFGQAEEGPCSRLILCRNMEELLDRFGQAPEDSRGISCAVQALLSSCNGCYFCRVEQEGISLEDYYQGLYELKKIAKEEPVCALFLPGVSDRLLIDHVMEAFWGSLLCMEESDFFDWSLSKEGG